MAAEERARTQVRRPKDKKETSSGRGVPALLPVLTTTSEEGRAIFDRQARLVLGISGEEFLCRWRDGYYASDPDQPGVMNVAMLLPLVQR